MFIKKRKSKKYSKSDLNSEDEFRIGSIKVMLNKNQSNNNSINNVNAEIDKNNDNTNNYNYNYNITTATINSKNNNKNSINNIQDNLNSNNCYNSNTLSETNLLRNNPKYPNINVKLDYGSLDMKKAPLIYDKNNMIMNANSDNKTAFYSSSVDEEDEPPPDYTEIYKSFAKQ